MNSIAIVAGERNCTGAHRFVFFTSMNILAKIILYRRRNTTMVLRVDNKLLTKITCDRSKLAIRFRNDRINC